MTSLAGSFLVARRSLQDPNFRQTVVLLLQHTDKGALGVVVNRQAQVQGVPFPVFAGGPCESEGVLLLHGHPEWAESSSDPVPNPVAPDIFLGDAACLSRIQDASPGETLHYRMFAGHAAWGPGQLEGELAMGVWAVVPATGTQLFDIPVDDLWDRLSPPALPQPSVN